MSLRDIERASIREFLETNSDKLRGRVLDYGAGKMPYRDIVERAGALYVPYDSPHYPGSVADEHMNHFAAVGGKLHSFDTVICTQVIQYVEHPPEFLETLHEELIPRGYLLMTGPTNWPHIEADDKWRFTTSGVISLLHDAGFTRSHVAPRAAVRFEGENWSIGWEAVAQA